MSDRKFSQSNPPSLWEGVGEGLAARSELVAIPNPNPPPKVGGIMFHVRFGKVA